MNAYLAPYTPAFLPTGNVPREVTTFLEAAGFHHTARHCAAVAEEARRLAVVFDADPQAAETAGWLHDASIVIPLSQRVDLAKNLGLEVLPEEQELPMILHQKLSAVLAAEVFQVTEPAILSAVACHTTLKAHSSRLDQVVFLADKIVWDQGGKPPYLEYVLRGCQQSLEAGVLAYLEHLWQQRDRLPVLHPWFVAAYGELSGGLSGT